MSSSHRTFRPRFERIRVRQRSAGRKIPTRRDFLSWWKRSTFEPLVLEPSEEWADERDFTPEQSHHPTLRPQNDEAVKVHYEKLAAHLADELNEEKIDVYFDQWLPWIEKYTFDACDQKDCPDDERVVYRQEVSKAYQGYTAAAKGLIDSLKAKAASLTSGAVVANLAGFDHQRKGFVHAFQNFGDLLERVLVKLFPPGEKGGTGDFFKILDRTNLLKPEVYNYLRGTCMPGMSPTFAVLPRFAWPMNFDSAYRRMLEDQAPKAEE